MVGSTDGVTGEPTLTVVVPAHNSGSALAHSVRTLTTAWPDLSTEVVIVENGSTDDTLATARRLAAKHPDRVRVICSETGLGRAYAAGIRAARGSTVLLTADDLPFGVSDVSSWTVAGGPGAEQVFIGSKAHPHSRVRRSLLRSLMTSVFSLERRVVLDMHIGDTQGTVFAPRPWLLAQLPHLKEGGYLFSTELLYAATLQTVPVTELPVELDLTTRRASTVSLRDAWQMFIGLLQLRRRRESLRAASR